MQEYATMETKTSTNTALPSTRCLVVHVAVCCRYIPQPRCQTMASNASYPKQWENLIQPPASGKHTMTRTTMMTTTTTTTTTMIWYVHHVKTWHGNQTHSLLQYCWLLVQSCTITWWKPAQKELKAQVEVQFTNSCRHWVSLVSELILGTKWPPSLLDFWIFPAMKRHYERFLQKSSKCLCIECGGQAGSTGLASESDLPQSVKPGGVASLLYDLHESYIEIYCQTNQRHPAWTQIHWSHLIATDSQIRCTWLWGTPGGTIYTATTVVCGCEMATGSIEGVRKWAQLGKSLHFLRNPVFLLERKRQKRNTAIRCNKKYIFTWYSTLVASWDVRVIRVSKPLASINLELASEQLHSEKSTQDACKHQKLNLADFPSPTGWKLVKECERFKTSKSFFAAWSCTIVCPHRGILFCAHHLQSLKVKRWRQWWGEYEKCENALLIVNVTSTPDEETISEHTNIILYCNFRWIRNEVLRQWLEWHQALLHRKVRRRVKIVCVKSWNSCVWQWRGTNHVLKNILRIVFAIALTMPVVGKGKRGNPRPTSWNALKV